MKEKKWELRKLIGKQLQSLTPEELREKSAKIARRLCSLPLYRDAEIILGYMPMEHEADITDILKQAFADGKEVAVPRMKGGRYMDFHLIDSIEGPWDNHDYGIREPHGHLPVVHPESCPSRTVLILVPGLAFDRRGNRLGRGKGFYDTYLSMGCTNVTELGIGFSFQIVDSVPVSKHDKCIAGIVTEDEVILA
jgi:5-formyltetrahydrofolate cyclo-ligase